MRIGLSPATVGRISIAFAVIFGSALLSSSPTPAFTKKNKAFYLDEQQVAFIRPGLVITITDAAIADDGAIKVNFKLTDPKGLPLDREGVFTPGAVSVSFIAATIPSGQDQFQAYTTRVQTSPINGAQAAQATGESNGSFAKLRDGEYQYTFRTRAPSGIDRNADRLIETLEIIDFWGRYVMDKVLDDRAGWETQNLLTVGRLVAQAALAREESRGVHYRSDFPATDDARFKGHVVLTQTVAGIAQAFEPVG